MGGICGVSSTKAVDRQRFEAMVDLAAHRGPNGRGSFYEGALALGHRHLAVLDLSAESGQPFFFGDKVVAVYNGEIYNHSEIANQLTEHGYTFKTACDTEVLLAAYDFYGEACVEHFSGMWAFAIYDRTRGCLFCSRDHFGVKPFYYMSEDAQFAFASEIKQLLHMRDVSPRANREALARFLILGEMDEGKETLFDGIFQLLPGHSLVFDLTTRAVSIRSWYTPGFHHAESAENYERACACFREEFARSVALCLRASVPVGSLLSGGIDSSAIVGEVHRQLSEQENSAPLQTVSSCYNEPAFNEQPFIDEVLAATGATGHKVFPVIDDDPSWLDTLIWHADEPLPSSSGYSQWRVFEEAARHGLTVALDGQGADEQLAGYPQFHLVYFVELLRQRHFACFWRELRAYKRLRAQYQPVSTASVAAFCLMTALFPKGLMRGVNSLFIRLRKPKVFSQPQWRKTLLNSRQYAMLSTRETILASINGNLRLLLHMEDRNAMAHGVEARVPFLDARLVETVLAMPFSYKIRDGVSKAVLRDAERHNLPDAVYKRHNKMGFPAPEAKWIRLNEAWFKSELAEACERFSDLLDKNAVMHGFSAYLKRPQNGEFVWWRIMCANRWAKVFGVDA